MNSCLTWVHRSSLPPPLTGGGGHRRLEDFVDKWQLDTSAQDFFFSLDREVQERVMDQFAPKRGGNVNGLFMTFTAGVARLAGRGGGGGGWMGEFLRSFRGFGGVRGDLGFFRWNYPWVDFS